MYFWTQKTSLITDEWEGKDQSNGEKVKKRGEQSTEKNRKKGRAEWCQRRTKGCEVITQS